MALTEKDIKWLQPLWLRIVIAVFLTAWCAWEVLWNKDGFWGLMVGAVLVYFIYNYLIAFPKAEEPEGAPVSSNREDEDAR